MACESGVCPFGSIVGGGYRTSNCDQDGLAAANQPHNQLIATWFSYLRDHGGGKHEARVFYARCLVVPRCESFYCCAGGGLTGPDSCWCFFALSMLYLGHSARLGTGMVVRSLAYF